METKVMNEKEMKLPDPNPRLTMKFLHTLIKEIQLEDQILLQKVGQLEQRMSQIYQTQDEIAATDEHLSNQRESLMEEIPAQDIPVQDIPVQEIRTTRAVRHAPPRRKSIWVWRR